EQIQRQTVIYQLCRPIWRRWITLEVLSGRIDAPDFTASPTPYLFAQWITPGWQWVDPQKEIRAQREAVDAGFMSRREVVAGRGLDIEALDAERAADDPIPSDNQDTAQ
ncbi:MAG: phage portal protein, partial [Pseudomonadota bacterium]